MKHEGAACLDLCQQGRRAGFESRSLLAPSRQRRHSLLEYFSKGKRAGFESWSPFSALAAARARLVCIFLSKGRVLVVKVGHRLAPSLERGRSLLESF